MNGRPRLSRGKRPALVATLLLLVLQGGLARAAAPPPLPALVLDLGGEGSADAGALLAADDALYLLERTSGEVRAFPLHGMVRAEQFAKVLRRAEGLDGLIIGQPVGLAMAGADLYVLDGLGSLFVYHPRQGQKALVGLRVEARQGTLRALAFPRGAAQLDVMDGPAGDGRARLWAYRRTARGYLGTPRLLSWPVGLAGAPTALDGAVAGGGLVLSTPRGAAVWWPGIAHALVTLAGGAGEQSPVVGTVWAPNGASPTVLLITRGSTTVEAWHISAGRGGRPLAPLRFTWTGAVPLWRAVSGDLVSGRLYLLDGRNRVFSLPLPAAWRAPAR